MDNDTYNLVYSQPSMRQPESLRHLFTPYYFEVFREGGCRPLTPLVYFACFRLFDAELLGCKLVKFLLHFGNSMLLYGILLLLFKDRRWSLLAAAVYFVRMVPHAFVGIAFVPDIWAATFCLAATLCHLHMSLKGEFRAHVLAPTTVIR